MNSADDFNTIFERVIGHEGRYQKHPGDRGNWTSGTVGKGELKGTKWGISAMSYPSLDIKNLSEAHAKTIYYNDWWIALRLREMPFALAYQMFDASINHGYHNAVRMLQRALGVKDDGIIGPVTRRAMSHFDEHDLLMLFIAERLEHFTNLGTWLDFGKGWARRIAQNLRYAAEDTPE